MALTGNVRRGLRVDLSVTRLNDIKREIERLSDERADLLHRLSEGFDAPLAAEHKALDERIDRLWEEARMEKARLRWGEREDIVRRARAEERLERAA